MSLEPLEQLVKMSLLVNDKAETLAASTIAAISTFVLIFILPYYSIAFAQADLDFGNFTVRNTTTAFASSNSSFINFTANASDQEQQGQQQQQQPSIQPSELDQEEQVTQGTQQEQQEQ